MELLNLTRYYPEGATKSVQFFRSEKGEDFYESMSLFTKRYKLCVRPADGVIRAMHEDVSRLYPAGFNVVEVDELPEGFAVGKWRYIDGEITMLTKD